MKSRAISLAERPAGAPTAATFKMIEVALPDPGDGQVLVKNTLMSVDPYMRGRMNDVKSYVPPFKLGEAMEGGAIGRVVKSNAPALPEGALVLHMLGFRDYAILDARQATPIDETRAAPSHYLGVLGVTGLTAYAGLTDVAQLKSGETMFVSAGAGAVGSIAGQLARLMGARAIGSTGSDENVAFMRDTLKFEGAFAARDGKIYEELKAAAPEGIDVYFDNVGGDHLQAALAVLNPFGRIAACGMISGYNEPQPGPDNLFLVVGKKLSIRGFIVSDHAHRTAAFERHVTPLLAAGQIVYPETVVEGIAQTFGAFVGMLHGSSHTGKLVVRVALSER